MGLRGILSAVVAATLAVGASPSLAASPARGTLTDHEYTLISAAKLGLEQALTHKGTHWRADARNACLTVTFGVSTPLLASEKVDCLGSVALEVDLTLFPAADTSCTARGPKRKILCLAPLYRTLARDSSSAYTGDVKLRKVIVRRGFTGPCLAALAPSQRQLRDGRNLVASTKQLSSDMYLLVRIADGQAPPGRLNQGRVDAHTGVFDRDLGRILRDSSSYTLNSCPHQPV